MSTKQELRAIIDDLRYRLHVLRTERIALRDELAAARADLAQLRDQLDARDAADPLTTPAPRPFRVGDRVLVAEGAKAKNAFGESVGTCAAGKEGLVRVIHADGDLLIDNEGYASPEFCTMIEDDPTSERVTLTLADGTRITFDAAVTR